ncbi:MAG TPA: hypothetical protein VIF83_07110 [Gemmatimonadaceae bacterium]|jgi:hypothetical protein
MRPESDLREVMKAGLDDPIGLQAQRLVNYITEAFGSSTAAVIHYGSRAQGSGSRPESAYDFFVIVDDYDTGFRSFASHVQPRFSARSAILLSQVLPPSVVAVTTSAPGQSEPETAKCAVLSIRDLVIACSANPPDHFTKGRLFQQVQLAWVRDAASRAEVENTIIAARLATFEWGRSYMPAAFDAEIFCRTLLTTSYAGEVRPETSVRIDELFQAQSDTMLYMYRALLADLADRGVLRRAGDRYEQTQLPSRLERVRMRLYFRRSKTRATLRWGKHVWLYDDWLEYVRHKVARRSGVVIELTPRERRWPFLFLWPKVFQYLRSRR